MSNALYKRRIDIKRLNKGVRILLKTSDEVYELVIGTPELRVVLVGSDGCFEHRDKAVVVGSIDSETGEHYSGIIEDAILVLRTSHNGVIRTGPIRYAKISADNVSYEYVLWENE